MTIPVAQQPEWKAALRFLRSAVALDDRPLRAPIGDAGVLRVPPGEALLTETSGVDAAVEAISSAVTAVEPSTGDVTREPAVPAVSALVADAPDSAIVATGAASGRGAAVDADLDESGLVDAFGNLGIACAVLTPPVASAMNLQAVSRADLLILDWRLGVGDEGDTAIRVLQEVALGAARGARRVVAIYTSVNDLGAVKDRIVEETDCVEMPGMEQAIALELGASWVLIVRKPGTEAGVAESELPALLVGWFAQSIRGLVPTATVHALSAVRDGLRDVVGRLGPQLDRGYVRHCLLLPHAEDGGEHLRDLIAAELSSIVDGDPDTAMASGLDAVVAWIQGTDRLLVEPKLVESHLTGEAKLKGNAVAGMSVSKPNMVIAPSDETKPFFDDELLAHRMTFRHLRFERPIPLEPGVVMRRETADGEPPEHYICVQPACDAVRLVPPTAPVAFLPCKVDDKHFDFVLVDGDSSVRLQVVQRLDQVQLIEFPVDPEKGVVLLSPTMLGRLPRTDVEFSLDVLGLLRREHARRLGQHIGNRVGRIGLDESEWRRRSAPSAAEAG